MLTLRCPNNPKLMLTLRCPNNPKLMLTFPCPKFPNSPTLKGMLIQNVLRNRPGYAKHFRALLSTNSAAAGKRSADDGQFLILGPPEVYRSGPGCSAATVNNDDGSKRPEMGYTENMSPTYLCSGNPCLDFFFHVVPRTRANQVTKRLSSAWKQDSATALKLVCNLRGVRGTGKSNREGFYSSALWLQENHPKTLAGNVGAIADFGYMKDLLEILYRLVQGPTARKIEKQRHRWGSQSLEKEGGETVQAKSRHENRFEAVRKGMERYNTDLTYRILHNRISEFFAARLQSDLENFNSGNYDKISLAAKWCPSLNSSFDYYTCMCESVARRLFPRERYPEYQGIEDEHYAYRVRDRLRKEVLVPLRKVLELPELYISAREWNSVVYPRVASIAMRNYKYLFHKHDGERFQHYLDKVEEGNAKIAAGALLPHDIVRSVKYDTDQVAELQWKRIVDDLTKIGKLKNCLAICDVSGSMSGEPLEVSVALGLLVSELSEEPWKGKLITFSEKPQLQVINGEDLRSKILSIEQMDWDMNTDFQRVFDRILEVAVEGKLTEDQMIKRLFVFSDMQFDRASPGKWETDYQAIVRKFNENGFSRVPEIVFWNLRNSDAAPVPSHQGGVALVSGFSKNLLKMFLEEGGVLDPVKTMEAAIAGQEYQKLVVLD